MTDTFNDREAWLTEAATEQRVKDLLEKMRQLGVTP